MNFRIFRWSALPLATLLLAACGDDSPARKKDPVCLPECSPGYYCLAGTCVADCNPPCQGGTVCNEDRICVDPDQTDASPPPDASASDAGADDAAEPDAPLPTDATDDTAPPEDVSPDDAGPDAPPPDDASPVEDVGETDTAPDASEPWTNPWPQAECTTADDCPQGAVCIAGGCAAAVAPDDWGFGGAVGLVSKIWIPSLDGEACCFDLDGDGRIDNQLSALIDAWDSRGGAGPGALEQLNAQLVEGRVSVLVEVRTEGEASASLSIMTGSNDRDTDTVNDQPIADRQAGRGVFQVDRGALGDWGPRLHFPLAHIEGDTLLTSQGPVQAQMRAQRGCPWRWDLVPPLAPDALCPGERPLEVRLDQARVEFTHTLEDGDLRSTDAVRGDETTGGFRLGGYLHLGVIAQAMSNSYADNCQCAGLGTDDPMFRTRRVGSRLRIECARTWTAEDLVTCESGQRMCFGIPQFCSQIGLVSALATHDGDGDGVLDSVAVGMSATVVPARIDPASPWVPAAEVCTDTIDNDGDGLVDCDDPACWDSNACDWTFPGEYCRNGVDDDGDGLVDCADPSCRRNRACATP